MNTRRELLRTTSVLGLLVACGLITTREAEAADASAFEQKSLADVFRALGGKPDDGRGITLNVPDVAENGAVVPVTVSSALPGTDEILILIEKNPQPLAAAFTIPEGTDPVITTRVKMSESSNVHAVVKAGGKFYATSKETMVTLGGCGA